MEHCPLEQKNRLAGELLTEAVTLCTHIFGNYVMQHLLEHGTEAHISSLTQVLIERAAIVSRDPHGNAVLEKCFSHVNAAGKVALANALAMKPDLLFAMGSTRHGNRAAKEALASAELEHRNYACVTLMEQKAKLRASRYGRALATFVEKLMQGEGEAIDISSGDDENSSD